MSKSLTQEQVLKGQPAYKSLNRRQRKLARLVVLEGYSQRRAFQRVYGHPGNGNLWNPVKAVVAAFQAAWAAEQIAQEVNHRHAATPAAEAPEPAVRLGRIAVVPVPEEAEADHKFTPCTVPWCKLLSVLGTYNGRKLCPGHLRMISHGEPLPGDRPIPGASEPVRPKGFDPSPLDLRDQPLEVSIEALKQEALIIPSPRAEIPFGQLVSGVGETVAESVYYAGGREVEINPVTRRPKAQELREAQERENQGKDQRGWSLWDIFKHTAKEPAAAGPADGLSEFFPEREQ